MPPEVYRVVWLVAGVEFVGYRDDAQSAHELAMQQARSADERQANVFVSSENGWLAYQRVYAP